MTKVSIELTEEQKENLLNLANVGAEHYRQMLDQISGYERDIMMLVGRIYRQQRKGYVDEDNYLDIHEAIDETLAELRNDRGKIDNNTILIYFNFNLF